MGNVWDAMKKRQQEDASDVARKADTTDGQDNPGSELSVQVCNETEKDEQMKQDSKQTDKDIQAEDPTAAELQTEGLDDQPSNEGPTVPEPEQQTRVEGALNEVSGLLGDIDGLFSTANGSETDLDEQQTTDDEQVVEETIWPEETTVPEDIATPEQILPDPAVKTYSKLLVVHYDRGGKIAEEYRTLRTSLLGQCAGERFCYVVTSAENGEGKTVTAINLGLIMAERQDRRTIIVDCDLRKNDMANLLAAKSSPGLADILRGTAAMEDIIQPTDYPNLFFVPAGQANADQIGKLLAGSDLQDITDEFRKEYDYVLLDSPPINNVSDAGMTARAAGEALLVARMNRTHRQSTKRAIRLLNAANVKLAGIVLTHWKRSLPRFLNSD